MTTKFNISLPVQHKTMSEAEALKSFGIKSISVPINEEGKVIQYGETFCGNSHVAYENGSVISVALFKSKTANKNGDSFFVGSKSSRPNGANLDAGELSELKGVGTSTVSTDAKGNEWRNYSSYITNSQLSFISQYINSALKGVEIEVKVKKTSDSDDKSDKGTEAEA